MEIRLSAEQELFVEVVAELAAGLTSRWQLGRGPDSVEPPAPSAALRLERSGHAARRTIA